MDDYTASSNQHDSSSNSASTIHAARASTASASDLSAGTSDGLCATSLSGATACKKGPRSRSVVTPLACTECRKKRAKCDGQRPCRRCTKQDVECCYKVHTRQSKTNLRNTIEQLRHQQASNELVINTLAHSRKWKEVLCQLRRGRSVEAIADWLRTQLSLGAIPSLSHLSESGADTNLGNLGFFSGVSDPLYTSELSDEPVSASTVSSLSSDSLLGSAYNMDTNSQWSQGHNVRSNSQPATDSSMCSDSLLGSAYNMDTGSQWSQHLEASQGHCSRSNSQPAADSSQPFGTSVDANDLVAFWANSVPLPVAPTSASSAVAGAGDSVEDSLFWPFPVQGQPMMPTGDAFLGGGFPII